jgi:hypothetical protein
LRALRPGCLEPAAKRADQDDRAAAVGPARQLLSQIDAWHWGGLAAADAIPGRGRYCFTGGEKSQPASRRLRA